VKKSELKTVLRPLIKECVKEVMFEDGILSGLISEVVQGLNGQVLSENTVAPRRKVPAQQNDAEIARQQQVAKIKAMEQAAQTRKKMSEAVGKGAYGGVDLFEGTTPTAAPTEGKQGDPLAGQDPNDAGVDISNLFGGANKTWHRHNK
jgi:hypothetical protein|tara:strand:- start:86 stop:529 length:444 start_codon:yes stop_codon:yes gene_type:complete